MAGMPVELFERAYGASDAIVAAENPVMYEVWREFAIRGPQVRLRLLLRLVEDSNSAVVANRLREGTERLGQSYGDGLRPSIGVIGEWLLIQADLVQLMCVVLPLTRWGHPLAVVSALAPSAIVDLLAPLDELLERAEGEQAEPSPRDRGGSERPERRDPPGSPVVEVSFTQREQEVSSWLLRMLARIWGYDADLDSERPPAAERLLTALSLSGSPGDTPAGDEVVESVSLDRPATPAVIGSAQVVKADAARRLFEIDASEQTWAVLDEGVNARHPAFAGPPGSGLVSRVLETFDLVALADDDLELTDADKGPIDHLVDVVQACAVSAWDGTALSPYREPISSHGTHVAGILAGCVPGEFEGICPDLRLWDFRVLDSSSVGNESRILLALRFIRHVNDRERAIRIAGVNMSISLAYDPKNDACGWTPVCEEVRRLVRSGVVVVVAAGNAGYQAGTAVAGGYESRTSRSSRGTGFETISITDPGNAEEAITVGATHGQHPYRYGTSFFSGKGPTADGRLKPDLLAPGEHIFGPAGREAYVSMDGTSQAAPHVAGAAALLMARYPELVGQPERVKDILCRTATDLGRDRRFQGYGLVDVLRAAQSV